MWPVYQLNHRGDLIKQVIEQLKLLNINEGALGKVGVFNLLLGEIRAPEQMTGVSLLIPRIFPKENHPHKKVSFSGSVDAQVQVMLDRWKLYLDTCATYHLAFVDWMLNNVHTVNTVLRSNLNASVTSTNVKSTYGLWEFWLNKTFCPFLSLRRMVL